MTRLLDPRGLGADEFGPFRQLDRDRHILSGNFAWILFEPALDGGEERLTALGVPFGGR